MSWGIRRRVPSTSGEPFRKPDEAAALWNWTRLQRTPAARGTAVTAPAAGARATPIDRSGQGRSTARSKVNA
jgi:hypothetical protein